MVSVSKGQCDAHVSTVLEVLMFYLCNRMKAGRAKDTEVLVMWVGCLGPAKLTLLYPVAVSHFAYYPQH